MFDIFEWEIGQYDGFKFIESKEPEPMEGNTMGLERRIKYNDREGGWLVIFNGKVVKGNFKTSVEAYQYLNELILGKKHPEYESN